MNTLKNCYGEIIESDSANYKNGLKLLKKAIKRNILSESFINTDKKGHGECLNYSIYDAARGKVLIQRRHTTIDKYGNHPQKDYFLISNSGKTVVSVNHKTMIVKWAKKTEQLGDVIKLDQK